AVLSPAVLSAPGASVRAVPALAVAVPAAGTLAIAAAVLAVPALRISAVAAAVGPVAAVRVASVTTLARAGTIRPAARGVAPRPGGRASAVLRAALPRRTRAGAGTAAPAGGTSLASRTAGPL
ncbi:MAG TPA: hypothetical protein VK586_20760, partial [Streptosporangiaceae bacterium]|nr:hypothetical protein [Streptosporangiaceae bacterium]